MYTLYMQYYKLKMLS